MLLINAIPNDSFTLIALYAYNTHYMLVMLLENSASTKCRPFQVKINWSKFIIDILQQRCHMTFLIFLLVASRSLLIGVFLPRKIITIYKK